ncbi:MAG: hypothetical protein RRC07_15920 [Anaerolineae bacterium]|nr:hypothetical protein [Anaerolineae bacterium]
MMNHRYLLTTLGFALSLLLLFGCSEPSAPVATPAATAPPPPASESSPAAPADASVRAQASASTPQPTPTPIFFAESFDGEPARPAPYRPISWDVAIHNRDQEYWYSLEPVEAGHGANCEGPDEARHTVDDYENAVYHCRDHLMTSINSSGYGAIYLTPPYMVDFTGSEAIIRWDLSTLQTSKRDWWDIWLTPFDYNLVAPLQDWLPDLNGEPRQALQIQLAEGAVIARLVEDHEARDLPLALSDGYQSFLEPSETRRDTFELRISRDHIRFGMPEYDKWWLDTSVDLDWTEAVVQFGHHSYNPTKDGGTPVTWHWDEIFIEPAKPFTILPADQRTVAPEEETTVSFPEPAPEGAYLRFAAAGEQFEVSFDGGPWQPAELQVQERAVDGSFSTYWVPAPAGTRTVSFRGENWFGGDWHIRDVALWARTAPAP